MKYLLRCYYRTRLRKVQACFLMCCQGSSACRTSPVRPVQVEAFTMSLLDTADTSDPSGPTHHLLSPKELTYAQVRCSHVPLPAMMLD